MSEPHDITNPAPDDSAEWIAMVNRTNAKLHAQIESMGQKMIREMAAMEEAKATIATLREIIKDLLATSPSNEAIKRAQELLK